MMQPRAMESHSEGAGLVQEAGPCRKGVLGCRAQQPLITKSPGAQGRRAGDWNPGLRHPGAGRGGTLVLQLDLMAVRTQLPSAARVTNGN